jgi:demethylmenaquinone methyltransferase/2-methoxy-6-polyprenyl-1,4-benzoquinol methylase
MRESTQISTSSLSTSNKTLTDIVPNPDNQAVAKGEQVQRMFDGIAARYDLLNDCISFGLHRAWKREACHRLALPLGASVLDICTGTGDLIAYLRPMVGEKGRVEGLDFSSDMLAQARQRFGNADNLRFTQGDAQALPYPDNYFDGVIISFGLRNMTNLPLALAEMHRVLKPGGRMVSLDTCPTPKMPLMNFYFTHIMPRIGALLAGNQGAYRYLAESTRHFLTPDQLQAAFEEGGCHAVESRPLMWGLASLQVGIKYK